MKRKNIFSTFFVIALLSIMGVKNETAHYAKADESSVTVTIRYVDVAGNSVATDKVVSGQANTTYSVTSPTVSGLIATKPVVDGVFEENKEVVVLMDTYDTYTTSTVASTDFVEEDGYYYIDSAADLLAFKDACTKAYTDKGAANLEIFKGKTIKLRTSIDWAGETFLPLCGPANIPTGTSLSIGKHNQAFAGTFDGGNHIISNMKYNNTANTSFFYGFFSALNGATIKNLNIYADFSLRDRFGGFAYVSQGVTTFDNVHVFGNYTVGSTTSGNGLSGGFVGDSQGTLTIKNSSFVGKITVANKSSHTGVGGFIGCNESTTNISNSFVSLSKGTVLYANSGGVVGNNSKGKLTIDGVKVIGEINALGGKIGGILGYSGSNSATYSISNCANYSIISSKSSTCFGGIVGNNQTNGANCSITNCVNYGEISSPGTSAGGINGWVASSTITNCTNYGKVSAVGVQAGGIVGGGTANKFSDCTNYGDIYSPAGTSAGISANGTGSTYTRCENYGNISSDAGSIGGIAGTGTSSTYLDCVNHGNIDGAGSIGGITGTGTSSTFTNCINNGNITSTGGKVGGITGVGGKSKSYNCWNHGTITATGSTVGGLVGEFNESAQIVGGGNTGNVTGSEYVGGIAGWNGINSTIDTTDLTVGGTVTSTSAETVGMVTGYTNNVLVTKYIDGVVVGYDLFVPGTAYTTTEGLVWYTDEAMTILYVEGTVHGTTSTNSGNVLNFSLYAKSSHGAVYKQLLEDIINIDTCTEYNDYQGLEDRVNDLDEEAKADLLATIFVDANGEECTIGDKLSYMSTLANIETQTINLGNVLVYSSNNLFLVILIALLGMISILGYYCLNKRKYGKNN